MYAIIQTGGKQYRVSEGDVIFIEKLPNDVNSEVNFTDVVAVSNNENLSVGTPFLSGATVKGTVIKNGRGKKITVFTYKPKKDSKRKLGHRQHYTKVRIESINS